MATSEFTGGGGDLTEFFKGSQQVFLGGPRVILVQNWGETTIKIVFSDPKIGGNVTLVQNFTLGMTPPQIGDVLGTSCRGAF